jgi:hypothetical protein
MSRGARARNDPTLRDAAQQVIEDERPGAG